MSSSGGRSGIKFDDVMNLVTNVATGGIAGYENGRPSFAGGFYTESADELLGEITGRNLQRQSMQLANRRFREEEARRRAALNEERVRAQEEEVRVSRMAAIGRRSPIGGRARTFQSTGNRLGPEQDFLGL